MEPNGEQLSERLMARDEAALREVVAAYGSTVYGIARRILTEPTLAEEVAQDTFLALWRRPGAFDPDRGSLHAFLLAIARNKAIDLVRREEAARRVKDLLIAEIDAPSAEPSTSEQVVEVDRRDEVKSALAKLPAVQKEAIVLAFFGGRTYREVAEELEIPEGTAKTRLRDGLTRLRGLMIEAKGDEGAENP